MEGRMREAEASGLLIPGQLLYRWREMENGGSDICIKSSNSSESLHRNEGSEEAGRGGERKHSTSLYISFFFFLCFSCVSHWKAIMESHCLTCHLPAVFFWRLVRVRPMLTCSPKYEDEDPVGRAWSVPLLSFPSLPRRCCRWGCFERLSRVSWRLRALHGI